MPVRADRLHRQWVARFDAVTAFASASIGCNNDDFIRLSPMTGRFATMQINRMLDTVQQRPQTGRIDSVIIGQQNLQFTLQEVATRMPNCSAVA